MFNPTSSLPLGGVLVGGQSRRFGSDKSTARVGGRSMAAWAVRNLRESSDPVVLLGGDGRLARRMSLPWRGDVRPGSGPLAGVATGLGWAQELGRFGLLVLACDLPLVTPDLVKAIAAGAGPDVDAVVARSGSGEVQPLCAWYGSSSLATIEACLARGEYSMRGALAHLRVAGPEGEWTPAQSGPLLLNVNTPDDLTAAQRWRNGAS